MLLILAGISIVMLTGENGILTRVMESKKGTEISEAKEQAQLDIIEWTTEQLRNGNKADLDNSVIKGLLTGKEYVGSIGEDKFTTKENGYEILYSELYSATTSGSGGTGDTGKPDEGETDDTPVIPGVPVKKSNKTYTKNGTAVIPVGFHIVEGFDDVSQGLVIADDKGNQFVWIPVTDESQYVRNTTYPVVDVSKTARDDTDYLPTGVTIPEDKTEAQVEKDMVLNAGGFYIASYEAGIEGKDTLVSKKDATVWVNYSQINAKAKSKTFINNDYVKSALISGVQWDVTMAFINGKLDGYEKQYDVITGASNRHTNAGTKTGKNEADKVCNIYDLEGNYWEYVAEMWEPEALYKYIRRGGNYNSENEDNVASKRANCHGDAGDVLTFRFVLYVKENRF